MPGMDWPAAPEPNPLTCVRLKRRPSAPCGVACPRPRSMPAMTRPLVVIYSAIVLDAVGIGLIFPILPSLLAEVTHAADVAPYIGIMTALYALMQFVFAPVLG